MMKRLALSFAAMFAAVALAIALMQVRAHRQPPRRMHTPTGYNNTVEIFIDHGWLRFDPNLQKIVPRVPSDSPMQSFIWRSFLEGDLRAFNERNPLFLIENDQIVELDPTTHRVPLPFADVRGWQGDLMFRPRRKVVGILRGGGAVISLDQLTSSVAQQSLPLKATIKPVATADTLYSAEVVNLFSPGKLLLGKVYVAGDSIIFNKRDASVGSKSLVGGQETAAGDRVRLDSGDLLKLVWADAPRRPSTYALLWASISPRRPPISEMRMINGKEVRRLAVTTLPVANDIVAALDSAYLSDRPEVRPRVEREVDVTLSLDADIHAATQSLLSGYCAKLAKRPHYRAAVSVMDATSGRLLAIASYPTQTDLEGEQLDDSRRRALLRNHNFTRLPIGSLAKVMISAAVVSAAPPLIDLRIPSSNAISFDKVIGLTIDPIGDHAVAGPEGLIDFETYLEQSSNRYAATLLTLSLAVNPQTGEVPEFTGHELAPEDRFSIGAREWTRAPATESNLGEIQLLPVTATRHGATVDVTSTLEFGRFAPELARLFDVETFRGTTSRERRAGSGDDLYDSTIWLPLLDPIYESEPPHTQTFRGVSPERENLALNVTPSYRGGFLTLILGGGASRWTTVKTAEAFSRLVTGRKVTSSIVEGIGEESSPPSEFLPLELDPVLRQRLMSATALVSGRQGTAHALHDDLVRLNHELALQEEVLGFFSKTGSPDNTIPVSPAAARAVDELIRRGALHLRNGAIHYRDDLVMRPLAEETGASVVEQAITLNPEDLRVLKNHGVSVGWVVDACAMYNAATVDDRKRFFEVREGKLIRLRQQNEIKMTGGTYTFTLAVYDKNAVLAASDVDLPVIDVVNYQPKRAVTASINIESHGSGAKVAVPLAKKLILEVLWPQLKKGGS